MLLTIFKEQAVYVLKAESLAARRRSGAAAGLWSPAVRAPATPAARAARGQPLRTHPLTSGCDSKFTIRAGAPK